MKLISIRQNLKAVIALGVSLSLLITQPILASGRPYEENPVKKNKLKIKSFVSRNNSSVKIYPDIFKRNMHVVAKGNDGKGIDFFVFDLQGTLVQNYKMKAKDHYRISNLERGSYIYRVFCGDEETASGQFEIR